MEGEYLKIETEKDGHYCKMVGDSSFAKAVNKKVSDYWVATGRDMPAETAAISVLADLYNEIKK